MFRRTTAITAALSVLALGSPFITSCTNPLADISYDNGLKKYEQGDYQGAIADYTKAIEVNPQNADAYIRRGYTKYNLKDYHGAIIDYDKALEINPQFALA